MMQQVLLRISAVKLIAVALVKPNCALIALHHPQQMV